MMTTTTTGFRNIVLLVVVAAVLGALAAGSHSTTNTGFSHALGQLRNMNSMSSAIQSS
jgi:hypothetical protein